MAAEVPARNDLLGMYSVLLRPAPRAFSAGQSQTLGTVSLPDSNQ